MQNRIANAPQQPSKISMLQNQTGSLVDGNHAANPIPISPGRIVYVVAVVSDKL